MAVASNTNSGAFEIAKAGWLNRQSTILKRWKRSWLVLYVDGILKYFESPDSHVAEDVVLMHKDVRCMQTGTACLAAPPDGASINCLFAVVRTNGERWVFSGADQDDAKAWHIALEQARAMRPPQSQSAPPPYIDGQQIHMNHGLFGRTRHGIVHQRPLGQVTVIHNGGNVYCPSPGQQQMYTVHHNGQPVQYYIVPGAQQGQTTIVYADDPYCSRHNRYCRCNRCDGIGWAGGMFAGAALGTAMMMPLLWW
ncbi:unnamed protein product [Owenia fusiformis]|uniref:Uncharacterized protein n=1 Tax=Owenia fusiformis TaxID=6347 RepID=A0A8J1TI70_OWEFU|nr:unnamed protein product [Owenia fusiformis]